VSKHLDRVMMPLVNYWTLIDLESFESFLQDMGERPIGHTLDRINSNDDYKKENCKWSTYKEQANNRRNIIEHT